MQTLSATEKEYLEYFWNKHSKSVNKAISSKIIAYLRTGSTDQKDEIRENLNTIRAMQSLLRLGLISDFDTTNNAHNSFNFYISEKGIYELKLRHPRLKEKLIALQENTPPVVLFGVGILGFFATIFTIVTFFVWLSS